MTNIKIPQNAIKDHNFVKLSGDDPYGLYAECSKCKIRLFVPVKFEYWNSIEFKDVVGLKIKKQGFYYYSQYDPTWDTVYKIYNLSCNELLIRDILL